MLALQNNAWELREFTKIPSDSLLEESVSDPECGDGGGGSTSSDCSSSCSSVTSEPYSTSSSVVLSEPCSSNSSVSAPSPPPPDMIDDDVDLTIPMEIPTKLSTVTTTTTNSDPQRVAVLSFEQVRRLNDVMNDTVSIHGRGNFPTLEVRLRDLVQVVRSKLEQECEGANPIKVRDIRLNGGCASHVLASESQNYNDLDLIFAVELSGQKQYDRVKQAVLASLLELLPEGVSRKRISTCSLKEAYVSKMVKVNDGGDRWSLISLGSQHRGGKSVELKFVDSMRRQFEFSVDSFQVVLDSLLLFYNCSDLEISENFYPTVVGESVYGDIQEALYHLHKKMIATRQPEEIRGGGLLKYCHLLTRGYKAAAPDKIKTLERYMCSRFFIDFSDILQQRSKLENYLWNHMAGETSDQYRYLTLLHAVVEESTVCLMGHERRQTLSLIEELACHVLCAEQHQRLMMFQQNAAAAAAAGMVNTTHHHPGKHNGLAGPPPPVLYNGYYYAPVIPANCIPCTCTWMTCS